ncbi:MAG: hypothetical protein ACODAD_08510, partial [Planctomycetota bacterium]
MNAEEIQLDREDVILLLMEANERLLRKPTLNGITRLEKLVFLLEKESSFEGVGSFFPFEPNKFGPFSKEVYEAVEFLEGCELVEVREKTYVSPYAASDEDKLLSEISDDDSGGLTTETRFALTENGRKVARKMREAVARKKQSDVEEVDRIIRKYGTRPLNHLIRYVYR